MKVLLVLRSLILILLAGLILRPEIHWTSSRKKTPSALIWVDNSRSIAGQTDFFRDSLILKIQEIGEALTAKGIKPRLFLFDEKVKPVTDKLRNIKFDGMVTDLEQVLHYSETEFENENIVGAILISDGVITRGEDPTYRERWTPFPIFTIGIGDSDRVMDPAVTKIEMPQTVSAGDTVVINAELIPSGNGDPITVLLKDSEKILQKKVVQSQIQALKKTVAFQIVPLEPGEKMITIEIIAPQDRNPYNNLRMSALKILESQTKIVIISGQGNFEARFLSCTLRDLKNVSVQNVAENNGRWFPLSFQEIIAKSWDLLIFIGYPTAKSDQRELLSLHQKIADSNLPIMFFLNSNVDVRQIERLLGWNPIAEISIDKSVNQIHVQCSRDGLDHPIIRNFQSRNLPEAIWPALPPIGMSFKKIRLTPSFQTIVESTDLSENPIIAVNPEITKRLAVCIGQDFWRWSFMTQEAGRIDVYYELFQGMARWLSDTLNTSAVSLTVNKKIFLSGETVEITGLLRDLKGLIVSDANIKAEIVQQGNVIATGNLIWDGKNYSGSLPVKDAGDYRVQISAWREEQLMGRREERITVIDRPIELLEIRQNADLLRIIATKSGGIKTDKIPAIIARLNVTDKIVLRTHIIKFLRWKWTLIWMIGLLAVEWSIRRLKGYQ